jgi:alkyl hydroperoxide reductase subunit AhpC
MTTVIQLGDLAPDFTAETTRGMVRFHEWKGTRWAMLFSHPGDFTPVCTTEMAAVAALEPEFARRDTRVIGLSVDPLESHFRWLDDIQELTGAPLPFPVIADPNCSVASRFGAAQQAGRHRNATRSTFLVDPHNRVRLILAYPNETGRNFREVLRVLDSLRLASAHGIATPANWETGEDVLLPVGIGEEEARARFPGGVRIRKPYLRQVACPSHSDR